MTNIPLIPHGKLAQRLEHATNPQTSTAHSDARIAPAPSFRAPPPLSLYVHIPWCIKKCPYCDFNSHEIRGLKSAQAGHSLMTLPPELEKSYVQALITDLESALPLVWGRRINSIFIGGGTPSLLSGASVEQLLNAIRSRLPLLPDAEITLEANPGAVEYQKFADFRAAGVNRLSLGIQSFNPTQLKALGRAHDDAEAKRAVELAATHFDNFNLDLMYGLPGQNLAQALDDLRIAQSFAPPHLSCYQLTLEPNTHFAAHPPHLPAADDCADMQDAIEAQLSAYTHYETSAFAKAGHQSQHNLNYWRFGDYLGIGAGAHSKLTLHDRVLRQVRWKQPKQYLAQLNNTPSRACSPDSPGSAVQAHAPVASSELALEFMMNALRLNQGFDSRLFELRTGQKLSQIDAALKQAEQEGLLERKLNHLAPSRRGQRFLNQLLAHFVAPQNP
ncbi:MAG: radical SAM family heme chaperone HemW [Pseudomonadota bacterium]